MLATQPNDSLIRHGTPEFRRTNLALFSAGFATFALIYCVQPLMPVFAREFQVSAAQSSLSLSLTCGLLAPTMILAGALSEARGRKSIMVASLLASAAITVLSAFATRWDVFLVARALAGITFAGLPAISMAYLSEEVDPGSMGLAMGLSIGGNGLGGMIGRLLSAFIADLVSWRWSMGVIGVLGLAAASVFWRTLPPSRHLIAPMLTLMLAGVGLTVLRPLACVVLGIAIVTFGFFGGHSVASSWVGLRSHRGKAQASALYLLFYYMGASVAGAVGGLFWERAHWPGVAGYVATMIIAGLCIAPIAASERVAAVHA